MSQPVSTIHGPLYIARQASEGTAATSGWKQFHKVSGNVATAKAAGSAEWLDGSRYADSFDYTSSIQVAGQFVVQGSADAIGSLAAWALGDDVISSSGSLYDHTITAATTVPYLTIVTALGEDPVSQVLEHYDVQISSLEITGSADNDVLTATVEVVGIHPGKVRSSEPTADSETEDPLLHYNAENNFVIANLNSGNETKEVNQAQLTISNEITPYFGDSVRPVALVAGRGSIELSFTVLATDDTLPLLNNYYYGTASPSNGDEPVADVYKDQYFVTYTRGSGSSERSVSISIPELVYTVEEYPEASANGDPVEIACTGSARIADGDTPADIIQIVAKTADDASYSDGSSPTPPPGP